MIPLQDTPVLILGLGASGLAMARWCLRCGAQVTVADTRSAPPQLQRLTALAPGARFVSGALDAALLAQSQARAVFRSPGLSPSSVESILIAANAMNIRVSGELGLFSAALAELQVQQGYAPQVLAVTGTNGKTTVTSLAGQLVERAGKTVAVAGNIGPTLLDTLTERLQADRLPEVWVLELSSFQLDGDHGFEPAAAAVLNLTQDHLDWHGSMAAYAQAKRQIFGQRALRVLNRDDPEVMRLGSETQAPAGRSRKRPPAAPTLLFGSDLPQRPGDFGLETVNGMTWLVRAQPSDEARPRRGQADAAPTLRRLMPADALRIRGRHNALNALAALALAGSAGCALAPMLYGLREYAGEPHRVQMVGSVRGVAYFDDSKGTNVGATVAALTGLGADQRVVVILGGEGKGQDFSPLADAVRRAARAVVLIGRDAPLIRTALAASGVPLQAAGSMAEAVTLASQAAQPGDAVLMSPACASFDMFDNYEHRARVFVQAVQDLAQDAGAWLEQQA